MQKLMAGYDAGIRIAPADSPRAAWLRQRRYCLQRDAELLLIPGPHVEPLVRQYLSWARR